MYEAGDLLELPETGVVLALVDRAHHPLGQAWHAVVVDEGDGRLPNGGLIKGLQFCASEHFLRALNVNVVHSEVPTVKRLVRAIAMIDPDVLQTVEDLLHDQQDSAAWDLLREATGR